MVKKVSAVVLTAMVVVSSLAGCGGKSTTQSKIDTGEDKYGAEYPLNADGKSLKLWIINSVHSDYKSYEDMPFFKEAEKRTGVKLEVTGPTGGQFEESFNLLIASGELPDIILYDWGNKKVAGGPSKYIKDGYIIPLNDVIDAYAPHLKKILNENPDIDKDVKTDDGQYYVFPNINLDTPVTYAGPIVRGDWLEDCGLDTPETIDDWHAMLKAFKDSKGSTAPLIYVDWLFQDSGFLSGAYGTQMNYYLNDDGKVEYGPATQKWKEFMTMMHQWYEEGLIDKDIATIDATTKQNKVISGKNGAFLGSGGDMGTYIPLITELDSKAKFVGVKYPVLNKGDIPEFGVCENKYAGTMSSAITTDCEDVELAAKFLDYFYSDEGRMFANFGVEGVTYNMVDGYPKLSDMVMESGNIHNKMLEYTNSEFSVIDSRYYEQRMIYPEQNAGIKTWAQTNAVNHKLPVLLPTEEESDEMTKYISEIETYVDEMYIKFMIGTASLDDYDSYLKHLDELGMQKVLDIYEKVYNRYKAR